MADCLGKSLPLHYGSHDFSISLRGGMHVIICGSWGSRPRGPLQPNSKTGLLNFNSEKWITKTEFACWPKDFLSSFDVNGGRIFIARFAFCTCLTSHGSLWNSSGVMGCRMSYALGHVCLFVSSAGEFIYLCLGKKWWSIAFRVSVWA